jgi:hypothetical protein
MSDPIFEYPWLMVLSRLAECVRALFLLGLAAAALLALAWLAERGAGN